jgi:glycine/serine hydroxymethyltransferase
MIPYDTRKPLDPSGIRIGTPAITTRGFDEEAAEKLAHIMVQSLKNHTDEVLLMDLKYENFVSSIQYQEFINILWKRNLKVHHLENLRMD